MPPIDLDKSDLLFCNDDEVVLATNEGTQTLFRQINLNGPNEYKRTDLDIETFLIGFNNDSIVPIPWYFLEIKNNGEETISTTDLYSSDYTSPHNDDNPHFIDVNFNDCLLYTSPSPRDKRQSRMPSSA